MLGCPFELGRELFEHDRVGDRTDDGVRSRTERGPAERTRDRVVENEVLIAGTRSTPNDLAIGRCGRDVHDERPRRSWFGRGPRLDDRRFETGTGTVAFAGQHGHEPFGDLSGGRVRDDDEHVDITSEREPVTEHGRAVEVHTDERGAGRLRKLARELVARSDEPRLAFARAEPMPRRYAREHWG